MLPGEVKKQGNQLAMKTLVAALTTIAKDEYEQFFKMFKGNDWLREVYNVGDIVPFTDAFKKTIGQYYTDKIDVYKAQLIIQLYQ